MQEIFSNTTLTVNQLIEKIDTGELGLPELQRPFIWKDSKVRDLFDSMMRGYPIGYLMLWECPALDKKKSIGVDAHSYDSPKEVIIDGQQRLTSLYAVMKGKKVINSKFDEKAIVISYCPLQDKFEVGYSATKKDPEWIYNISELFTTNNTFKYWKDNMDILDDAPSVYYPIVCEGKTEEEIRHMEEENALPHGWENMAYEDFLEARRKLMAAKIKAAFEQLKKNVE